MELPKEFFAVLDAFIERRALDHESDYTDGKELWVNTSDRVGIIAWYGATGDVLVHGFTIGALPGRRARANALLAAFGDTRDIVELAQTTDEWWLKVCGPLTAQAVRADRAQAIQRAISAARNST